MHFDNEILSILKKKKVKQIKAVLQRRQQLVFTMQLDFVPLSELDTPLCMPFFTESP